MPEDAVHVFRGFVSQPAFGNFYFGLPERFLDIALLWWLVEELTWYRSLASLYHGPGWLRRAGWRIAVGSLAGMQRRPLLS